MYCWYTRNTYLDSNIKELGKTTQCGIPVDLSKTKIDVPVHILASRDVVDLNPTRNPFVRPTSKY